MTCTKCRERERTGSHAWCRECQTAARQSKRLSNAVSNPVADVQSPVALDTLDSAPVTEHGDEIDPETGEVLPDPRVHQAGWRGLPEGRGGIGWQPGHGPDSGKGCCRHLVCYDALRPTTVLLRGVQGGAERHPRWCKCSICRPAKVRA